jgi:hypothetical protein
VPFDPGVTRIHTGITPHLVHARLALHAQNAGVVDASQVWMVTDDEVLPSELPSQDAFLTVRFPSLTWDHGHAMIGAGDGSELIVGGQVRVTYWSRAQIDYYGRANLATDKALGGNRPVGKLVRALHNTDVLDSSGRAILKQPVEFVSYDPPPPGAGQDQDGLRPYRLTFSVLFSWDLSQEI